MPISEVYNCDCLEYMRSLPDKHFDLCIADPPYGLDFGTYTRTNKLSDGTRVKATKYKKKDWDKATPLVEVFEEIIRVSKDAIIWGGNYFPALWEQGCKGIIFWDKRQPVANFSDGELAWSTFDKVARCFRYAYYGNINSEPIRFHPTQKPVALYSWILDNYAKGGVKSSTHFLAQVVVASLLIRRASTFTLASWILSITAYKMSALGASAWERWLRLRAL